MYTSLIKAFFIFMLGCWLVLETGCHNVDADYQDGVSAMEAGDYKAALKNFHAAADEGHADAQAALGELYYKGKGTDRNAQEAAKWYRLAAEQGQVDAQVTLGWMYNAGTGVPQDFSEAIKWFRLAADQGHPGAQNNLGVLYRQGREGHQNVPEAVKWFKKAAAQNIPTAQYALGQMYLNGEGVPQSVEQAVNWYTRAANLGLPEAQADLGYLYASRKDKVAQDFLIAYQWLSLATEQGDKIARSDLERLKGTMTPEQIEQAEQLLQDWKRQHSGSSGT